MEPFKTFDLGSAMHSGFTNAIAATQMRQASQEMQDRQIIDQAQSEAAKTGEDPTNWLAQRGFVRQSNALRDVMVNRAMTGFDYLSKGAKLVNDQKSYDAFKSRAQQMGITKPGELPDEYDKDHVHGLAGWSGEMLKRMEKYGAFQQVPGLPAGTMGQPDPRGKYENIQKPIDAGEKDNGFTLGPGQTRFGKDGKPIASLPDRQPTGKNGEGGDGFDVKAADENTISGQSASIFGGMYDPIKGTFQGLSKDTAQQVQALSERATRLYKNAGGDITRTEAVAAAARGMGINIRNLGAQQQGGGMPAPGGVRPMPPNAKQAPDGKFYVPDPARPGKWLRVEG